MDRSLNNLIQPRVYFEDLYQKKFSVSVKG